MFLGTCILYTGWKGSWIGMWFCRITLRCFKQRVGYSMSWTPSRDCIPCAFPRAVSWWKHIAFIIFTWSIIVGAADFFTLYIVVHNVWSSVCCNMLQYHFFHALWNDVSFPTGPCHQAMPFQPTLIIFGECSRMFSEFGAVVNFRHFLI